MLELSTSSPFKILQEYERRILQRNVALPSREEVRDKWAGIAFHLGEQRFVVAMSEIAEILEPPSYAQVPCTQSWFVGIANIRGALLPISDLNGFFYGTNLVNRASSRVLMFNKKNMRVGVKVENVLGLKHFYMEEKIKTLPPLEKSIAPFVHSMFKRLDEEWLVLSLRDLVASEAFLHVTKQQAS
ncbi:MAG: chemotaxis protein CheW [Gammaproteobacteria bacterium]|nr:chemotaxis protein CheW [Gammaproteobacteria bacterium]